MTDPKNKKLMSIGSKEKNTPGNFSEKDNKLISNSTVGKLANVTVGVKRKGNNDLTLDAFKKQKAEIKKNIGAASKKIDSRIKSDSLTSVLNKGSVSEKQQKKFDDLRNYSKFAKKTYGDSKKTLGLLEDHYKAYKGNYGVYKDRK